MKLVSISASVTAKDGFIDQAGFAKLNAKVEKAVKGFSHKPMKVNKNRENFYALPGYKAAQVKLISKALKQVTGVQTVTQTATKASGKTPASIRIAVVYDLKANKAVVNQIEQILNEGVPPLPVSHYVVSAKSKTVDFNAAKQKAQDPAYLAKRAVKIAERAKLSAAVRPLLSVYAKGVLPDALQKEVDQAIGAIKAHIKALGSQQKLVQGIREDKKAEREKVLDAASAWFSQNAGEGSTVKAAGMMGGSTVIVKLGDTYVSIVPSTKAAFNAAKKAAQ